MAAKKKVKRPAHKAPAKAQEEKGSGRGSNRGSGGGKKSFDNTNRGALFPNDKDGNEKRPDHTGIADIEIPEGCKPGQVVKFRLAGWERESQNGDPYLSLTIQKADKQGSNRKTRDDEGGEDEGDEG